MNYFGRFALVLLLVMALMLFDTQTQFLQPLRYTVSSLTYPLKSLRLLFEGGARNVYSNLRSRSDLIEESAAHRDEILQLRFQVMQMHIQGRENRRLRRLLALAEKNQERSALGASLLDISAGPGGMVMTLNQGQVDGVRSGDVVLDGWGLVGQIVNANLASSDVLLLTDPRHSLMAEVERTGNRVMVVGGGTLGRLDVRYVTVQTDIVEGDVLFTSGLGGIYAPGYPVGEVVTIEQHPGEPYLAITARPLAQPASSSHFLILAAGAADE